MSVTCTLGLHRASKAAACAVAVVEMGAFCFLAALNVLGSALLWTSIAAAAGWGKFTVATGPWQWFKAAPVWILPLAAMSYLLLVTGYWLPRRDRTGQPRAAAAAAVVVKAAIFVLFTLAHFLGAAVLGVALAGADASAGAASAFSVGELIADTPIWAYALLGAGCLLLVTAYFSPPPEGADRVEMWAFTIFLAAMTAIGVGSALWDRVVWPAIWSWLVGGGA